MAADKKETSFLVIEEFYDAADENFLHKFYQCHDPKKLGPFAQRWASDSRPWAREKLLEYLDSDRVVFGHQAVIKRLFKTAEARDDLELVARFVVYFDRLVQHTIKTIAHWDWESRTVWKEERLVLPANRMPLAKTFKVKWGWKEYEMESTIPRQAKYFSNRTRFYLQRRVWRYLRRLAFQKPDQYCQAIAKALTRYEDKDVERGENVLDRRTLMHACFRHSDALKFLASRIVLKEGKSLGEMKAAPRFLKLWQSEAGFQELLALMSDAKSRLVRIWSHEMLAEHHQGLMSKLPMATLVKWLSHPDSEIRQMAASALSDSDELNRLSIDEWLQLLETDDLDALETLCQAMQKRVSAERLSIEQAVALTCLEASSIAGTGLEFLKQKRITSEGDRELISRVAHTRCFAVARQAAKWGLSIVGSREDYNRDHVLAFFDSLHLPAREEAWKWLVAGDSPGFNDSSLFVRLLENPFSDLRLNLVELLEKRTRLPGAGSSDLTVLWSTVLLGIHNGGRQKLKAIRQLAAEIKKDPENNQHILEVIIAALRSIRRPESKAALVSIVGLLGNHDKTNQLLKQQLPTLELVQNGGSR